MSLKVRTYQELYDGGPRYKLWKRHEEDLEYQRIKSAELGISEEEQDGELPNFPSFIPFLPPPPEDLSSSSSSPRVNKKIKTLPNVNPPKEVIG